MRRDYIFILLHLMKLGAISFGPLDPTLPLGKIVVEPSSVRSLAAGYLILIIFKPSHLFLFHNYVVVYKALKTFQQFKLSIILNISI